jgi:hypothetical protein
MMPLQHCRIFIALIFWGILCMKNYIAVLPILLLLLVFVLQSALEEVNDQRSSKFDILVFKAIQNARTDGYFKPSNINQLRTDLKNTFPDLTDGDIQINVTTSIKYRQNVFDERESINYDIAIPVRKAFIAGSLFGISDSQNNYILRKKGYVLSEVLMP